MGAANYAVGFLKYVCLKQLIYLHKPLQFHSSRILLHSSGVCDKASMLIIICFVLSNLWLGWSWCGMLSLSHKSPFVGELFVLEHLLCSKWGLVACPKFCHVSHFSKPKWLLDVPPVVINSVWLSICTTFLSVSLTASPWSVPRSELDLGEIALPDAGILWLIGGGRLKFFCSKFVLYYVHIFGLGAVVIWEGVCNSSLTFLPLSFHTFILEGSGSFASNCFNSLTTWFEFFWSVILSSCYFKMLNSKSLT